MTWSLMATIVSVLNGLRTLWKSFFGKSEQASSSAGPDIAQVNSAARQEAQIARDTAHANQADAHEIQADTAADRDALARADSVRNRQEILAAAVARANSGPDDPLR